MYFEQKIKLLAFNHSLFNPRITSWLFYFLSRTTQQVVYVLENTFIQLRHWTLVPACSNTTDLTEQHMGDNIYARKSFLSFWK